MQVLKTLSVVAALSMAPAVANAATLVTFQNGPNGGGTDQFTVSCTVACEGWMFDAETLGDDIGGLIDFKDQNYATGNGKAWEENLLATIAGDDTLSFEKSGEDPPTGFISNFIYHLFKIGNTPNVGVLVNTAGVSQSYQFAAKEGEGAGLSHIASYGTVAPIPLPPAALLFLTGLAGMGLLARRRRVRLGGAAA